MSRVKRKLPAISETNLVERMVDVSVPTRAVVATENPIQRFDETTNQVVNEVLLMDGIVWRGGRNQIPIVDSHNDRTVRNIFGSIQELQVSNGELFGKPVFASDAESQMVSTRMAEGHITDFSITAQPLETIFVKRGETYTTPRGVQIPVPALIHKRWQPLNASICATGADEDSTVRRSYTDLVRKVTRMDEALLAQLSAAGLPDGMTDPNQVLSWCLAKLAPAAPVENSAEPVAPVVPEEEVKSGEVMNMAPGEKTEPIVEPVENQIARALSQFKQQDQVRRKEIQSACKLAKVERAFADELCDAGVSVEESNRRIIERMATQPLGSSVGADVRVTESGDDKFYSAARDGLLKRSFKHSNLRSTPFEAASSGHEDFEHARVKDIARDVVERMGIKTRNISPQDMIKLALGHPATMQRYKVQRDSSAYHTTGSFQNLLADVSNKTLLAAYEESPSTWQIWARQAESVEDFKPIYRTRISEMADIEQIPESQKYPESALSDKKESYRVEKYGSTTTVAWETFINDDLNALSRIPVHQGRSARRTQNRAVYGVLTANAELADTGLLFNSTAQSTAGGHANLSGGSANPSVSTLNTVYTSMMTKYGLNSKAILSIMPAYIIVPAALSGTLLELLGSISPPSAGGSAVGNANVKNIYGPNGDRPLTPVVEPMLDANSTTAWYVASNSGDCDTVELAYLQGEESPVIENDFDFDRDVYKYKVRQTFGVAAIDFRGLYKYAAS
jgi:hypothetical protein